MNDLILRSLKPILDGLLDKAAKAVPGSVEATIAKLVAILSTSHEAAIAVITGWYDKVAAALIAWLPTTTPKIITLASGALAYARGKLAKF